MISFEKTFKLVIFLFFTAFILIAVSIYNRPKQTVLNKPVKKNNDVAEKEVYIDGPVKKYSLQAEIFKLENPRMTSIRNIAIDNENGNIGIVHANGWTEIPYKNGKILLGRGFVAKMRKQFDLKAIASIPKSLCAYNAYNNEIIYGKKGKYKLNVAIAEASSMAYYKNKILIIDKNTNQILIFGLKNKNALIINKIFIKGARGVAAKDNFFYYSVENKIFKCNENLKTVVEYTLNVIIDDFTVSAKNEFLAVNKNQDVIYRFKF